MENFFAGGEEYFIRFEMGQHVVKRVTDDSQAANEIVFQGHYEQCLDYKNSLIASSFEYDHNL